MTKSEKMLSDARKIEEAFDAFRAECMAGISPLRVFVSSGGITIPMGHNEHIEFRFDYSPSDEDT